jgi:hypothetical protein
MRSVLHTLAEAFPENRSSGERCAMTPIQITVTDGTWFAGCELDLDSGSEVVSDKFAEFAIAVFERHGVDAFGLGLSVENVH